MIVYREQKRQVRMADALRRIAGAADPVERLIETGEVAAGVADALSPEFDSDLPPLHALPGLPETVTISVPEGFAYYALYPEMYRLAARAFQRERRPGHVAVIGIRSIGATLGTVVADELAAAGCEVHRWTVRPRGHPFERRLAIAPDLDARWRALCGDDFAVVDEGPGMSGSSFAAVAEHLSGLGIPDERIALFPSWQADAAAFVSETARRRWPRHRKYVVPFEDLHLFDGARDLSGGEWRAAVYDCEADYPPAQPRHERRKYLRGAVLWRFAGLGRYGRETLERARSLAEAGFAPTVEGLDCGFLGTRWIAGRPVARREPDPVLLETMARYLAFLHREFPRPRASAGLEEMIRVNVEEGLGAAWAAQLGDLEEPDGPACAVDNRMFPHEWLATAAGYVKTDATDHHDDHFYPGPRDIAWDLAAAIVEFAWTSAQAECLIARYAALSGDREIRRRRPFYRLAWLAFRLGYADMAAAALGAAPDAARFRERRAWYAALLREEIAGRGR